jgi:hypothetical protein
MEQLADFLPYEITSFDSTSPMLRAFKDGRRNYLGPDRWYPAIRVPQSQRPLRRPAPQPSVPIAPGVPLRTLERRALQALRGYARHTTSLAAVLAALQPYRQAVGLANPVPAERDTLAARPWETCDCRVCREAGIEVLIYRDANRNRRRGFHNLERFYQRLCALRASLPARAGEPGAALPPPALPVRARPGGPVLAGPEARAAAANPRSAETAVKKEETRVSSGGR